MTRTLIIAALFVVNATGRCWGGEAQFEIDLDGWVHANHNDVAIVTSEAEELLNSELIPLSDELKEAAKRVRVSINPTSPHSFSFTFGVDLKSEQDDDKVLSALSLRIQKYVSLRLHGHTRAYAFWLAYSEINRFSTSLLKKYPSLPNLKDEVAFPWIVENAEFRIAMGPEHWDIYLVVIDGDLAWRYLRESQVEGRPSSFVMDAIEVDSRFQAMMAATFNAWNKSREHAKKPLHEYDWRWAFARKYLKKNFGITWRDPMAQIPPSFLNEEMLRTDPYKRAARTTIAAKSAEDASLTLRFSSHR